MTVNSVWHSSLCNNGPSCALVGFVMFCLPLLIVRAARAKRSEAIRSHHLSHVMQPELRLKPACSATETRDFGLSKHRYCTIKAGNNKDADRTEWMHMLICIFVFLIWTTSWENCLCHVRTTKALDCTDADQPAHSCSLISAFVVRFLDSIIPLVSISEISSLYLVSVTVHSGLSLHWSQAPKTGFLMTRLIWL